MAFLIPSDRKNIDLTLKSKLIRVPRNQARWYNLRLLKKNDLVFMYSTDESLIYGPLVVDGRYREEKNPVNGPFNGLGRVDRLYYYISVKIKTHEFYDRGVRIDSTVLNVHSFSMDSVSTQKVIERLEMINKMFLPLVFNIELVGEKIRVTRYEGMYNRSLVLMEDYYDFSQLSMEMVNYTLDSVQRSILDNNFKNFLKYALDVGRRAFDILFSGFEGNIFSNKNGYAISFIVDKEIWKLPLELLSYTDFLFKKSIITYGVKNMVLPEKAKIKNALVLADPTSGYEWAYIEGKKVFNFLTNLGIRCDFISRSISIPEFFEYLENYDLIHIAGHNSGGFLLGDEKVFLGNELKLKKQPKFIFLSFCGDQIDYGKSLLKSGVGNVVFTRFQIPDFDSTGYILEFYRLIFEGISIGKAFFYMKRMAYRGKKVIPLTYILSGNSNTVYEYK